MAIAGVVNSGKSAFVPAKIKGFSILMQYQGEVDGDGISSQKNPSRPD